MRGLRSKIPPPNWLVTFEAGARCLSFTKAAEELNVTRVAVSQQIKSLEEYLDVQLFHRMHRSLRLTRAGEQYYRTISDSLQNILSATYEVQKSAYKEGVTVTTSTGFATYWLLPRIGEFRRLHSETEIQLLVADSYLDLSTPEIDVAIRYGDGDWPNVNAQFLLQEEIFPVCSPAYLGERPGFTEARELLAERLLHLEGKYDPQTRWLHWFREQGVNIETQPQGLRLNTYTNLVQAALDGQGIALIGPPLMKNLLETGALVRPIDVVPTKRRAFYLARAKDAQPSSQTTLFCDWLEKIAHQA